MSRVCERRPRPGDGDSDRPVPRVHIAQGAVLEQLFHRRLAVVRRALGPQRPAQQRPHQPSLIGERMHVPRGRDVHRRREVDGLLPHQGELVDGADVGRRRRPRGRATGPGVSSTEPRISPLKNTSQRPCATSAERSSDMADRSARTSAGAGAWRHTGAPAAPVWVRDAHAERERLKQPTCRPLLRLNGH
jgi:hypothetical protein